ncbi:HNH endonuclease signature motif containing protein [Streptomyces sp. NPDC050732]|uniref:HNH endonuclease n=1 Tax=Streptomyces sp. NPDC050732 TaxID=3154632 RepID=UPI00342EE5B0
MVLSGIGRSDVLRAVEECDRRGRDVFLRRYGFKPSRSYLLVVDGRYYDSKAIVGVAHGYLPGEKPLTASEFSGGRDHAAKLLGALGFQVVTQEAVGEITVDRFVDHITGLRVAHAETGPRLYQPVVLLWAIGRAFHGEPRTLPWSETSAALSGLLRNHGLRGERVRPDYPVLALFHAGLWTLDEYEGTVPPAHGDAVPRRWFAEQRPVGGLVPPAYELMCASGQARVAAVQAITDRFFGGLDEGPLLADVGLYEESVADDRPGGRGAAPVAAAPSSAVDPVSSAAQYERLCTLVERREASRHQRRREGVSRDPIRSGSARRAVLIRSEGRCENPVCGGQPDDVTDAGDPILEIDHIEEIAGGGRDHPSRMIALCPNCHAVKTRGRTRAELREAFLEVVRERHRAVRERHQREGGPTATA